MKKSVLVFYILFTLSSKAQTNLYHDFPENNASWRVDWGEQTCFVSGLAQAKYRYYLLGDTLLNGTPYNQVIREFGSTYICGPSFPSGSGYMGGLRQDTMSRQVYFIAMDSTNESILYDFSLSIGDTVPDLIFKQYTFDHVTIAAIDSILVGSIYRKSFTTSNYNTIVEGIGSLAGLLEISVLDRTPMLICYSEDSTILYRYSAGVDCDLTTNLPESISSDHRVNFYPNPLVSESIIRLSAELIRSKFFLYDIQGKQVRIMELTDKYSNISKENLPSGFYFYKVISYQGNSVFGKLAIE